MERESGRKRDRKREKERVRERKLLLLSPIVKTIHCKCCTQNTIEIENKKKTN